MNNLSIGIMQGRILPKFIDRLQVFPINTWREEFSVAKDIGFQHVELLWDGEQDIKNAKGLTCFMSETPHLHTPSICVDSICSCTSLQAMLNEIIDVIDTFKENTPSILVIPLLGEATINTTHKLKEFIDEVNTHNIKNLLQTYNVKLALELDMHPSKIIEAMESTDLEFIGICLDSGNLWHYSATPIQDIRTLSKKIIHVHIKDRDLSGDNVLLGDGIVDFRTFFEVLKDIEYSGLMTLETKYFKNPLDEAKKNFKYISKIVQ